MAVGCVPRPMPAPFARPIDRLAFVVPDLEKEIRDWLEHGVGPWFTIGGAMLTDYEYVGIPSSPRMDAALSQVGPVQLELIHPADDEVSIYRDFIGEGGNGLHHAGWFSDDLDRDRASVEAAGHKLLQHGSVLGSDFAYYELAEPMGSSADLLPPDTVRRVAGAWDGKIAELVAPGKKGRETFANVRAEASGWDRESDPVRHLLSPVRQEGFELHTLAQSVGRWFKRRNVSM
jgi:Glyoxalase/Bleomycin resistance protein/Dioxygenase superfamily